MPLWPFKKAAPATRERREPVIARPPALHARSYAAAMADRLRASWALSDGDANAELRANLARMRNAARSLERDNSYAMKYLTELENNVVGATGIGMQSTVRGTDDRARMLRRAVEDAWGRWARPGVCSIGSRRDWVSFQRLALRSIARDGEVLIRIVRGVDNGFGFALQMLEADHLDEQHIVELRNGRRIWMGVEMEGDGTPVAYHILNEHPGAQTYARNSRLYERVPADQIMHLYVEKRVGQTRGVPWLHSAINSMQMLAGYEEAELIAARVAAAKMGFIMQTELAGGGDRYRNTDADEVPYMDAEAGSIEVLPYGYEFRGWDPQHPTSAFPEFRKAMLRTAASGLGLSYNALANDLENVNYSSLRQGALADRDNWRALQMWFSGVLHQRVFEEWLPLAMLAGAIRTDDGRVVPYARIDDLSRVVWRPRGWGWVDPQKEVTATIAALQARLKSRTGVLAEQGTDYEELLGEIASEEEMAAAMGVSLSAVNPAQSDNQGVNGDGIGQEEQDA